MEVDGKIAGGWQSEDDEVTVGFGNMDPDRNYLQSRSGNGTSTTASVGNVSESSRKKSGCQCCSCCTCLLVTRIIDLLLLLVVSIVQGSLLNYLLIWHRQESHTVYLWFLVDFLVVISFVGALTSSYMRIARRLRTAFIKPVVSKSRTPQGGGDRKAPVYGTLPLSYISWLVYSSALAARIVVVFHTGVVDDLGQEGVFTPQRFKIVLCVSSVVFLLLVHAHGVTVRQRLGSSGQNLRTDAQAAADRRRFISSLCATTAFEVFDAVAFLELLFPAESGVMLPYSLEAIILTLVTVHLLLPAASLYQLSLCDFGSRGQRPSAKVGLLFSVVKLLVVEVPYLGIRAYLWDVYGASTSVIFLMKNVLMIFVKVRYLIPEYVAVWVDEKRVDAMDAKKDLQMKSLS